MITQAEADFELPLTSFSFVFSQCTLIHIYISPKCSSELFPGESNLFSHKLGVFSHILIYLQVFVSRS